MLRPGPSGGNAIPLPRPGPPGGNGMGVPRPGPPGGNGIGVPLPGPSGGNGMPPRPGPPGGNAIPPLPGPPGVKSGRPRPGPLMTNCTGVLGVSGAREVVGARLASFAIGDVEMEFMVFLSRGIRHRYRMRSPCAHAFRRCCVTTRHAGLPSRSACRQLQHALPVATRKRVRSQEGGEGREAASSNDASDAADRR